MTTSVKRTLDGTKLMRLRRAVAPLLPLPCGICSLPVLPGQRWDLDHAATPVALGGGDDHLAVAHATCNRKAGRTIQAMLAKRRREIDEHHAPGW